MNDLEFDDLLRAAKDNVSLPASFRHGVWHRLESEGEDFKTGFDWFRALQVILTRPLSVVSGFVAIIPMGLWLGASGIPDIKSDRMAYAQSISPFTGHPQK